MQIFSRKKANFRKLVLFCEQIEGLTLGIADAEDDASMLVGKHLKHLGMVSRHDRVAQDASHLILYIGHEVVLGRRHRATRGSISASGLSVQAKRSVLS